MAAISRNRQAKPAKHRAGRRKPSTSAKPKQKAKRDISTTNVQWRDIEIQVAYERNWLGLKDGVAHLEIRVLSPKGAIIPLTDTGYRSHFISSVAIEEIGDPASYVRHWLDAEAEKPNWKKRESSTRQLTLF